MSTARRMDRLERRLVPEPTVDREALDAELEQLAAEYERDEGPGSFEKLLADFEAQWDAAR